MAPLHSRIEGSSGTPVLIIHGWTMAGFAEAADFEPILSRPEYADKYKRIYVDLPGHGDTPADGVKDLDEMFERLVTFIEKILPAPQKFLVSGSSCGAYFARAVAWRFRERVGGLLLRVPHVGLKNADRDIDPFKPVIVNEAVREKIEPSLKEHLENGLVVQTPEYLDAFQSRWKSVVLPAVEAADTRVLRAIRDDPARYVLTVPMVSEGRPFTKPALIVTGRQDSVVGYRDSWALLSAYPRASFVLMDRAGHGLPVDETPLFKAVVEDWLRRVEETEASQV